MLVTLQLANQVRRLCRQNLNVGQIAGSLGLPEQAIMETLAMLGLPLPGEVAERHPLPSDEERAAIRAKMPKKWQQGNGALRESARLCRLVAFRFWRWRQSGCHYLLPADNPSLPWHRKVFS